MNVLLIGPRGCGKSTVGRLLAEQLGRAFIDLDDRVLAALGSPSVQAAWCAHGEPEWRRHELAALVDALANDRQVIALGGGTPTVDEARAAILRHRAAGRAAVVYLRCDATTLTGRLQRDPGDRPPLTSTPLADEVATILARRQPIYAAIADLTVDAAADAPNELAAGIATDLRRREAE